MNNNKQSHAGKTHIVGVGTAASPNRYTQTEILALQGIEDEKLRAIYLQGGIETRHLSVAMATANNLKVGDESQGELLDRHRREAIKIGSQAILNCIAEAGARVEDIAYLCCVTSTGFLVPSLSILLSQHLGLAKHCHRADIVGMGCSAGLNGLQSAYNWSARHPEKLGVVVCAEVCSAAYVSDNKIGTAVVNSLFGDGASAIAVRTCSEGEQAQPKYPYITQMHSYVLTEQVAAMNFSWQDERNKYSFYLSKEVPYAIGHEVKNALSDLIFGNGLRFSDIDHWVIHSGGKKVLDAICLNLNLPKHAIRHTKSVLRDYGNVSSGSFLFSLQRLGEERCAAPGDIGVFMTMGPGMSIESALVRW
ncbi:3,5-dihydroxyphenylacetyl-CoA synthase DpgA [Pseudoalteromonas piscicida]|uniref:3,5-dihydroxyphenylacetyl-CoA synthase DpgA n=1 Tax=Pseudoalteromonas piscicida TaxID=43662 RepID=UPI0027E41E6B|nr:3,5-dihydroxyphenylacetyl-CoA synthase DpgA [Pseudoalteromonas piscicida]WMO16074.1 type III polyketide synthase [Pseudoalteromonas piscicida]